MQLHFARHGIPEEVIYDNGPQFNYKEFKNFANKYEFIDTTLPHGIHSQMDPQSIQYNLALLRLRNTPIYGLVKSLVQLLMGRKT